MGNHFCQYNSNPQNLEGNKGCPPVGKAFYIVCGGSMQSTEQLYCCLSRGVFHRTLWLLFISSVCLPYCLVLRRTGTTIGGEIPLCSMCPLSCQHHCPPIPVSPFTSSSLCHCFSFILRHFALVSVFLLKFLFLPFLSHLLIHSFCLFFSPFPLLDRYVSEILSI